jgi:predicted TIM-barrel fold metal-dependent hydrolase
MLDINTFIGAYPFRYVPHPQPDVLVRVLEREGVSGAWVGHLPSAFHRDPMHGNAELFAALEAHRATLHPVPIVRPDWPDWSRTFSDCVEQGVPAVRVYPAHWGFGVEDSRLVELADACASAGVALVFTVRFEDLRQRHPNDVTSDLAPATVRYVARAQTGARLVVTAAGRDFVEEVHWGLTPDERARVWWDISWIWGPPERHLAHLFQSIGAERFVYGSQWPLRLAQTPRANLALLPDDLDGAAMWDASEILGHTP